MEESVQTDQSVQVEVKPIKLVTDMSDVFVLMLLPELPAFKVNEPLEDIKLCGRSILDWSMKSIDGLPYRKVAVKKNDDLMTIVRDNTRESKYTVVLYADTPLMTAETIEQAVAYVRAYGHHAGRMSRGWVFETETAKTNDVVEPVDIPNLAQQDFIVAYNYGQLSAVETIARQRINLKLLGKGVRIEDINTAYIDADVVIERGVVIEPNVRIKGTSNIKAMANILTGSIITNSFIGENSVIGPYAYFRGGVKTGKGCRVFNFVEAKDCEIGDKTTIKHMTYVSNATIGKNCNIGNGVVFANYAGKKDEKGKSIKNHTTMGDNVFVGCNCNLVAPLMLEDSAYIAAGSTITKDVPKHALAIARTQQNIKENYWNVEEE